MSARTEILNSTLLTADARALRAIVLWAMLGAKMLGGWGVQWDIRWHLVIGRDWFWIAPHVMTYAGVTLAAVLAFGVLAWETWRARRGLEVPDSIRVIGLVGTRGFHLAWWGMAITILAAPIDDLWHRLFGIDVTLWSPPHLLGIAGAQVNTLGCLAIALELWGPGSRARRSALLVASLLLLGAFQITVDPAIHTAFRRGGVFFFAWAILGSLAFGFALVLVARLTGMRSAPLLAALGALAFHWVGLQVSDVGFAIVQPTPAIEEAIAADPDSPIAVAHEMARRNGATTAGRALLLRYLPVLPAALLALIDARRRWAAGVTGLALSLVAVSGWMFARIPALSHALPTVLDVVVAAPLAVAAALAGGGAAAGLARLLAPHESTRPV
ncbi:MAG: hypothetical protein ACREK6_06390 [Candidatus Rokuibacteriota bacterium]